MALEHVGRDISVGDRFSKWTVVAIDQDRPGRATCRCECGTQRAVQSRDLRSGKTKSCGCGKAAAIAAARTTHGGSTSPEYGIWAGMKRRCSDPSAPHYDRYGGRGIKVCARWEESFAAFIEDMGARPPGTTLDRRDGNGDYEPGNCRWATAIAQQNNRANNRYATLDGRTQTVAQWARELEIFPTAVKHRAIKTGTLHRRGERPTTSTERTSQ